MALCCLGDATLNDSSSMADDMTGALEAGREIQRGGIRTLVSAKPVESCSGAALVYDTETRHSSPQAASREVEALVLHTGPVCPRLIYKRPTPRSAGTSRPSSRHWQNSIRCWRAGYAPCYPALGRK